MFETRDFLTEVRAETGEDGSITIRGVGVPYNKNSRDMGFIESFAPGAFSDDLASNEDRVSLFNHDSNYVLGRQSVGTLRIIDDSESLRYEVDLPDSQTIRDLVAAPIARGDVAGSSFQFRTISDEWRTIDGVEHRTVTKATIREVGPVVFPAYPDTTAAMRSLDAWRSGDAEPTPQAVSGIAELYAKIEAGDELTDEETRMVARYIDDMTGALAGIKGDTPPPGTLQMNRNRQRMLEIL